MSLEPNGLTLKQCNGGLTLEELLQQVGSLTELQLENKNLQKINRAHF